MTETGQHTAENVGKEKDKVSFLVALEHAPLVTSVLGTCGIAVLDADKSEPLGLTRIGLDPELNPEKVRDAFLDNVRELFPHASWSEDAARAALDGAATRNAEQRVAPDQRTQEDDARVDAILAWLRAYFELRYAGWSPTMGKNRRVEEVSGGGGTVSHGGGPAPTPSSRGKEPAGTDGFGITVGVLDTAVDRHRALAGRYLTTSPDDFLEERATQPYYAAGHATFVTGLILNQAPGATVRVRNVLGDDGIAQSWDVANAIVELGRTGINILNLSFVCYTRDGKPPLALATAVDRLEPDILVVACAGNHGDPGLKLGDGHRKPSWPAALDDVVAVGSGHPTEAPGEPGYELSWYTPPETAWIDVITWGDNRVSTYFTGAGPRDDTVPQASQRKFDGWASWSGTSFSAALVSGRVAAKAAEEKISARAAYRKLVDPLIAHTQTRRGLRVPPFLPLDL
jgi:membrane-anchored mycosin MYCP